MLCASASWTIDSYRRAALIGVVLLWLGFPLALFEHGGARLALLIAALLVFAFWVLSGLRV